MVCPVGNDIAYMIRKMREGMAAAGHAPEGLIGASKRAVEIGSPMGVTIKAVEAQVKHAEKDLGFEIPMDAEGLRVDLLEEVLLVTPRTRMIYTIPEFQNPTGATLSLPSAIQADVIDYDELLTGERREGQYIGLWSIAKKLAAAVGIGAGLALLGMAGYTPNVEQTESVRLVLRTLYALVPSLCNLAGLVVALAYPINDTVHGQIRRAIARKRAGQRFENPLAANSAAT